MATICGQNDRRLCNTPNQFFVTFIKICISMCPTTATISAVRSALQTAATVAQNGSVCEAMWLDAVPC